MQKQLNTSHIEEAEIINQFDKDGKIIELENPDLQDMLFYHSPDNKFFYIVVLGKLTTPKTFREAFKKAINVSKRRFDWKIRKLQLLKKFRKDIEFKIITVADDTFINSLD